MADRENETRPEALTDAQRARDFEERASKPNLGPDERTRLEQDARQLAREAEIDPGLAEELGRTRSESAQQRLTVAANQRAHPSKGEAYVDQLRGLTAQVKDPARQAQMAKLVEQMGAKMGMNRETSSQAQTGRDFEAER
ncbi:MAG: hypothetical protein AAFR71_16550 [Pseudomonadota bacterium]